MAAIVGGFQRIEVLSISGFLKESGEKVLASVFGTFLLEFAVDTILGHYEPNRFLLVSL